MEGKGREAGDESTSQQNPGLKKGARVNSDTVPLTQSTSVSEDSIDATVLASANDKKKSIKKSRRTKHKDYRKLSEKQASPSLLSLVDTATPPQNSNTPAEHTMIEMEEVPVRSFQNTNSALAIYRANTQQQETSRIALSTYYAFHGRRSTSEILIKGAATLGLPVLAVLLYEAGGEEYVKVVLGQPTVNGISWIFPISGAATNYLLGTLFASETLHSIKNADALYVTGNDSTQAKVRMYAPLGACFVIAIPIGFSYAAAYWQGEHSLIVLGAGATWVFNILSFTFAINETFGKFISLAIRATTRNEAKLATCQIRDRLSAIFNAVLRHASENDSYVHYSLLTSTQATQGFAVENLRSIIEYSIHNNLYTAIINPNEMGIKPSYASQYTILGVSLLTAMGVTLGALGFYVSTERSLYSLIGDATYPVSLFINLILGFMLGNWGYTFSDVLFSLVYAGVFLKALGQGGPSLDLPWTARLFPKLTAIFTTIAAFIALFSFGTSEWLISIIPTDYLFINLIPITAEVKAAAAICGYIFIPMANSYGLVRVSNAFEKFLLSVWPGIPRELRDKINVYLGLESATDYINSIPQDQLLAEFAKLPKDLQDTLSLNIPNFDQLLRDAAEPQTTPLLPTNDAQPRARRQHGFFPSSTAPREQGSEFLGGVSPLDNEDAADQSRWSCVIL